ncbi:MAG TPA: hypothetical protein VFK30_04510, partial [Anaerolineae bacterium]|nr:hypothetical protein [Anaerolineae bacterium]
LFVLALILTAIILVLAMMLLITTRAHGSSVCMTEAEARSHWPRSHLWWHDVNRHCWDNNSAHNIRYRGHQVAPDVLPVHAEAKPIDLDANGGDLTPYDEVMEKPQPTDECCWPPLDERTFKSRWDEVPELWLTKQ